DSQRFKGRGESSFSRTTMDREIQEITSIFGMAACSHGTAPGSNSRSPMDGTMPTLRFGSGMWSNQMRILLLLGIVLVVGCSLEDHASYEPANNDLATGGPLLVVEQGAPVNLDEVTESLGQEDLATFQASLSWYGTER